MVPLLIFWSECRSLFPRVKWHRRRSFSNNVDRGSRRDLSIGVHWREAVDFLRYRAEGDCQGRMSTSQMGGQRPHHPFTFCSFLCVMISPRERFAKKKKENDTIKREREKERKELTSRGNYFEIGIIERARVIKFVNQSSGRDPT